jgi:hypothetical protein
MSRSQAERFRLPIVAPKAVSRLSGYWEPV